MRDYNLGNRAAQVQSNDYNSGPLVNLINIPRPLIRGVVSAIGSAICGSANLVTGGSFPRLHFITRHLLDSLMKVPSDLFVIFMRSLHPGAKFEESDSKPIGGRRLVNLIPERFVNLTETLKAYPSDASFGRKLGAHIGSRAAYGLLLVGLLAGRVVDAVLMPFAVLSSVGTLGFCPTVNRWAYKSLMAPLGIVDDVFYCAVKILNPWAEKCPPLSTKSAFEDLKKRSG